MGFLSKLFEKKECSICGGEIGLLGNRKLEDGNMCKNCAAKLSPFFIDRRSSTVEEINTQLAYREENQEALKTFQPTKQFGEYEQMIIEEKNNIPTRFVICEGGEYQKKNADLISFKDVSDCSILIDHSDYEITRRNEEGKQVSYDPPRYKHNYNFKVKLTIENNPYFDVVVFKLNRKSVEIVTEIPNKDPLSPYPGFDPIMYAEYRAYKEQCDLIEHVVECGRKGEANIGFEESLKMTLEMLASRLADAQAAQQQEPEQEEKTAGYKFCPNCGAPVEGMKFCGSCGNKLG